MCQSRKRPHFFHPFFPPARTPLLCPFTPPLLSYLLRSVLVSSFSLSLVFFPLFPSYLHSFLTSASTFSSSSFFIVYTYFYRSLYIFTFYLFTYTTTFLLHFPLYGYLNHSLFDTYSYINNCLSSAPIFFFCL